MLGMTSCEVQELKCETLGNFLHFLDFSCAYAERSCFLKAGSNGWGGPWWAIPWDAQMASWAWGLRRGEVWWRKIHKFSGQNFCRLFLLSHVVMLGHWSWASAFGSRSRTFWSSGLQRLTSSINLNSWNNFSNFCAFHTATHLFTGNRQNCRQWEFRFARCLKLADAKWRLFWDHELVEFQRTCHRHFVWNSFAWFIDTSFAFSLDQFVFHSGAGLCHGPMSDIASSGWPVRQPSIWLEPGANKFPRCYRLGIPWPLKMNAIEAWTALAGTKLLQVSYAKRMARSIFMQDRAGNFWRQKVTLEEFRFCLIHLKALSNVFMLSSCCL